MGASSCASAFPDGVVRACARQGARTRDGADEESVVLGAELGERTGPCRRSERKASGCGAGCPGERRCKARDAVTSLLTAALRAPHRGDGAGARAVAT